MMFKTQKERGNDFPAPLKSREARDRPHAQAREAESSALEASATISPKATTGVWGPCSPRFEKACFRKLLNATWYKTIHLLPVGRSIDCVTRFGIKIRIWLQNTADWPADASANFTARTWYEDICMPSTDIYQISSSFD
jgi:hypothetical protein